MPLPLRRSALLNIAQDAALLGRLKEEKEAVVAAVKQFADSADERTNNAARGVLLRLGELQDAAAVKAAAAGRELEAAGAEHGGGGGAARTRYSVFLSHKARKQSRIHATGADSICSVRAHHAVAVLLAHFERSSLIPMG